MKTRTSVFRYLGMLIIAGLLITACAPAAPTPAVQPPSQGDAPEATAAIAALEAITLTYMVGDVESDQLIAKALVDAYMELHPNVTIEIENRPGGGDGDNIVKTRLATGEMTDLFSYNAGSLLQALNPSETLVDLTNEPFMAVLTTHLSKL
jgi:raffinose/stachyose/melibiose transport system substrate-binding protein